MENDGIQRLLKAEDDAAQVIQKAREGPHRTPTHYTTRIQTLSQPSHLLSPSFLSSSSPVLWFCCCVLS